jgi:phosphoribosylformylglycinamidine synthase II
MVHEIRVTNRGTEDPKGRETLHEILRLGLGSFTDVRTVKVYRIEGLKIDDIDHLAQELVDLGQRFDLNMPLIRDASRVVEIGYKPGVMNPEAASLMKVARDLGLTEIVAAASSTEYHFYGQFNDLELDAVVYRLLCNKTVEMVIGEKPQTLLIQGEVGPVLIVPVRSLDDQALMVLSKDKLFLNLEEMHVIQMYFRKLDRDPTDVELETLAQTWSEHCGHKTFKARPVINGLERVPFITRLQTVAAMYDRYVLSSFVDNSGVIEFYDGQAICAKVETHNSPSAIEPYGGAATGSGGVFRDILGTGQGAKVILSTDMFCFAPPDLPASELPQGCLHPHYLLRRVVAGVRDYGNRMGIPTANGSVHFHPDFRAKPSVIVGAFGIIPVTCAKKGVPQPGDLVVALGGRTGRDGIHGATFSSGEMTDRTISVNSSAVQIGNAIEEKRTSDALLELRDRGFIRAVTDCGAGGFSSAIGEMGAKTGVRVTLEKAPLKYSGLAPWEIWVSESQERMVIAIRPEHIAEVQTVCAALNVEATVLGYFTDDKRLVVSYDEAEVCNLSMEFLHDGLPKRVMNGSWVKPEFSEPPADLFSELDADKLVGWYKAVLGHRNVASKESIVRCYDHGVQGTSALPPFSGAMNDGPNDAVILRPLLDKPYGMVVSHGLNPVLNLISPFLGSLSAGIEAIANAVAVGADPQRLCLIDNFIWPFPDEQSFGALDEAVDACCVLMRTFKIPFVSGKDSLSGTYRGKQNDTDVVIKIPPVLCVSAFGPIPDVAKTVSADFKRSDSRILLVGTLDSWALGGSVFYDTLGFVGNRIPRPYLSGMQKMFIDLHQLIVEGKILAVHDVSEGGIAATLAEMCFGGNVGAELHLELVGDDIRPHEWLFNETPGCFLVEVRDEDFLHVLFDTLRGAVLIGTTTPERNIVVNWAGGFFRASLDDLKQAWQQPMKEVFSHAT